MPSSQVVVVTLGAPRVSEAGDAFLLRVADDVGLQRNDRWIRRQRGKIDDTSASIFVSLVIGKEPRADWAQQLSGIHKACLG